jgi:hypothetical protein
MGKSRYKYKTPASIPELLPGRYQISLRIKGYRTWNHEVSVEEGKAVNFDDIILLPERLKPDLLVPGADFQSLSLLRDTDTLILKRSLRLKDLFFFDREKEESESLLKDNVSYGDFPVSDIYSANGSRRIIIGGGSLWSRKFYLIDPENKTQNISDISGFFDGKPAMLIWGASYQTDCFAVYDDYINRLNLSDMSLYPKYLENVKGFGLSGKWLYILDTKDRISRTTAEKQEFTTLFEDKYLGKNLFNKSRFYRIQFIKKDIFLFWGNNGDLVTTVPPYVMSSEGVTGTAFHDRSRRLMFWTGNNVWIADFNEDNEDDVLFSGRIRLRAVYENGKDILQCFWAYNGTHIILRDEDRIFLFELMPDGKHHIEYITDVKNNSDIFYSDETGCLYYLDKKGSMMKLKIVTAKKTILAPFTDAVQNRMDSDGL